MSDKNLLRLTFYSYYQGTKRVQLQYNTVNNFLTHSNSGAPKVARHKDQDDKEIDGKQNSVQRLGKEVPSRKVLRLGCRDVTVEAPWAGGVGAGGGGGGSCAEGINIDGQGVRVGNLKRINISLR